MVDKFKLKRLSDGEEITLTESSLLIGRSESCDIRVTEGHPSREHARIAERDGAVLVQDLHSTNGTFVNNKRIEMEATLQPGDVVKFGDEGFSVQSTAAPEATVLMRSLGDNTGQSVTVIEDEDEDDEDSTAFLELYAMPPGWEEGPSFSSEVGKLDEKKQQAIERYLEKFNQSLKGKRGIFLIFFTEDEPPVFKSLVAEGGKAQWTLGRSDDCDVDYYNPCISKKHATITWGENGWQLRDGGPTNGILHKGRRCEALELTDGMTFEISSVEVLVRFLK